MENVSSLTFLSSLSLPSFDIHDWMSQSVSSLKLCLRIRQEIFQPSVYWFLQNWQSGLLRLRKQPFDMRAAERKSFHLGMRCAFD